MIDIHSHLLPGIDDGSRSKDLERIFVTSGLSSQKELLPRFNNLPEIAMITINGGSDD